MVIGRAVIATRFSDRGYERVFIAASLSSLAQKGENNWLHDVLTLKSSQ